MGPMITLPMVKLAAPEVLIPGAICCAVKSCFSENSSNPLLCADKVVRKAVYQMGKFNGQKKKFEVDGIFSCRHSFHIKTKPMGPKKVKLTPGPIVFEVFAQFLCKMGQIRHYQRTFTTSSGGL